MRGSIRRTGVAFFAAFSLIALGLIYWGIVQRDSLLARDDNPRRVLEEQRIQRGQVYDRNGEQLTETRVDEETGFTTRYYPYEELTPVLGYYSLRYGVAGIEDSFDAQLRGEAYLSAKEQTINDLLHRPMVGGDVQLTVDREIQEAIALALGERRGAVVLLNAQSGDILAMVSHPIFDPNTLDDEWDSLVDDPAAPLVNRATQGLYQPGTILQSILLSMIIQDTLTFPPDFWQADQAVPVEDEILPCAFTDRAVRTLEQSFYAACPTAFQTLVEQVSNDQLYRTLADFQLLTSPLFELPVDEGLSSEQLADEDPIMLAMGQGELQVSPLQMALVAATFANGGQMPTPRLVGAIRSPEGDWELRAGQASPQRILPAEDAALIHRLMGEAATQDNLSCDSLIYGHTGLALAGPEGTLNGWFIGFRESKDGQIYALAVLIEDITESIEVFDLGCAALSAALR